MPTNSLFPFGCDAWDALVSPYEHVNKHQAPFFLLKMQWKKGERDYEWASRNEEGQKPSREMVRGWETQTNVLLFGVEKDTRNSAEQQQPHYQFRPLKIFSMLTIPWLSIQKAMHVRKMHSTVHIQWER